MFTRARLESVYRLVMSVLGGGEDVLANRRRSDRLPYSLRLLCRIGGEDYPAELLDLGRDGLGVRSPVPLSQGTEIFISTPEMAGRQRLRCRVAWSRRTTLGTEAGLNYCDSAENMAASWVHLALSKLDADRAHRRTRRIPAGIYVELRELNGTPLGRAICLNLGTGGAQLRTPRPLDKGDVVVLALGAGEVEANIVLPSRVANRTLDPESGEFLVGVRFFPGENRDHQRLRSLLLALLDDLKHSPAVGE